MAYRGDRRSADEHPHTSRAARHVVVAVAVGVAHEVAAVSGFWSVVGLLMLVALGSGMGIAFFWVLVVRPILALPVGIVAVLGIAAVVTFGVNHYGDGVGADSRKCRDGTHLETTRDSIGNVTDWFCVGNQ
jgi:hypothetical protein